MAHRVWMDKSLLVLRSVILIASISLGTSRGGDEALDRIVDVFREEPEELTRKLSKSPSQPSIGIGMGLDEDGRLEVRQITRRTPASAAGLQVGDVITHIAGHAVGGMEVAPVVKLLQDALVASPDTPVDIQLQRANLPLSVASEAVRASVRAIKRDRALTSDSAREERELRGQSTQDLVYDVSLVARDACKNAGGSLAVQMRAASEAAATAVIEFTAFDGNTAKVVDNARHQHGNRIALLRGVGQAVKRAGGNCYCQSLLLPVTVTTSNCYYQ